MGEETSLKKITAHCKEYGFIFPSSEIYDGLAATYDYGPWGVLLKQNIRDFWWKSMVQLHENIVGLDAAIFMHPTTWKASGHVDAFHDPLIDNKDSKKRYRADQLIEMHIDKLHQKIEREVQKARKRFKEAFDEDKFRSESPKVQKYQTQIEQIRQRLHKALQKQDWKDLHALILELQIADPVSGSRNWTEVRQFNLMFSTQLSNIADERGTLYLRPETAQGIFVNFTNVLKTTRQKLPFGIAQVGKAFRNEIVARQFIFRMREFEQMEMQFFVQPGTELQWFNHWKEERLRWHQTLGFPEKDLRFHTHENLAHYANAAVDIEYHFPFGYKEIEGIHSRTDFDLKQHEQYSGKKLRYYDPDRQEHILPYVIETSIGLDRTFLAVLSHAYTEETVPDAEGKPTQRTVLKLPAPLAPIKCAVLPLVRTDERLTRIAQSLFDELKLYTQCHYEEKDTIGRRYRRQDAIGTPYCITVDFQTLEDHTVTIRHRDTLQQQRIPINQVRNNILQKTELQTLLKSFYRALQNLPSTTQ